MAGGAADVQGRAEALVQRQAMATAIQEAPAGCARGRMAAMCLIAARSSETSNHKLPLVYKQFLRKYPDYFPPLSVNEPRPNV